MGIRWRPKRQKRTHRPPWTIAQTIRRADGSLWLLRTRFVGWWRKPTETELESFSGLWSRSSSSAAGDSSATGGTTQTSLSSTLLDGALPAEGASASLEPGKPPTWTLEDELGTEDFADRGWHRLVDLADYLAHLVDGRTLGLLAVREQRMFERVVGLASVVKAAAQWFALDHGRRPTFVVEAEKYLAESRHGQPLPVPLVVDRPNVFRTGPVVTRQGARGAGGRLHSLHELVRHLAEDILGQLSQEEVGIHLEAYRAGAHRNEPGSQRPKQWWVLPRACGEQILMSFARGTLADLLRQHDFRWDFYRQLEAISDAIADFLEVEGDVTGDDPEDRRRRMEAVSRRMIQLALAVIEIPEPKDLFRDRRGGT